MNGPLHPWDDLPAEAEAPDLSAVLALLICALLGVGFWAVFFVLVLS